VHNGDAEAEPELQEIFTRLGVKRESRGSLSTPA
jgi:hypothetical protein